MDQPSAQDQEKLDSMQWTEKPCAICEKAVTVTTDHEGETWCLEHGGTWKEGEE